MRHDYRFPFEDLQSDELDGARKNYPMHHSLHEGYAILLEEMDELKDEIWLKPSKRDYQRLLEECVQIAAMAQRLAEDVIVPVLEKQNSPLPKHCCS